VQGAEVQALEGGHNFLKTTRKLVVEMHDRFNVEKKDLSKSYENIKKI